MQGFLIHRRPQATSGVRLVLVGLLSLGLLFSGGMPLGPALAQQGPPNPEAPPSLKVLAAPAPPDVADYVQDKAAAIQLGKALFWDMQVGSDGVMACASCHFHAGADSRRQNQLSPGLLNRNFNGIPGNKYYTGGDVTFGNSSLSGVPGNSRFKANYTLAFPIDFPFHTRLDPDQQESPVTAEVNDVASSQGIKLTIFTGINPGNAKDSGTKVFDPVFTLGGGTSPNRNVRRVEPVNAPTVINAVFNFSNFWNGRANHIFNGENSFGPADQAAGIWVNNLGNLQKVPLSMKFASLASQAVAPPVSDFEMSFGPNLDTGAPGRTWAHIGKKMLSLKPLGKQRVHPQDRVLGSLSLASLNNGVVSGSPGLNTTYADLIKAAFKPELWNSPKVIRFSPLNAILPRSLRQDPRQLSLSNGLATVADTATGAANEFSQMEANFSFIFGVAVQLYQATLVSDDSPFDRFQEDRPTGLPPDMQAAFERGLEIFHNQGRCNQCHGGSLFTNAAVDVLLGGAAPLEPAVNLIERMAMAQGEAFYDTGFYNIGARPTNEDIGRGGNAPFLNPFDRDTVTDPVTGQTTLGPAKPFPLSFTRLAMLKRAGKLPPAYAALVPNLPCNTPCNLNRAAVDGAMKVPTLRNIELTGPYFRNGGNITLRQVVDFYTRGADFRAANLDNLDPFIAEIGFLQGNPQGKSDLVAFLLGLTDERVKFEKAPFDHPQLFVTNGTHEATFSDIMVEIPAVGADGRPLKNGQPDPLRPVLAPAAPIWNEQESFNFHNQP